MAGGVPGQVSWRRDWGGAPHCSAGNVGPVRHLRCGEWGTRRGPCHIGLNPLPQAGFRQLGPDRAKSHRFRNKLKEIVPNSQC
ncbi:hypothetical protein CBM2592_A280074 [Cupriavidus taiwanensis]|nr:hypothetical protein CBM2592_A280074 [Cupriavidus taiwanensis]SOY52814.1 hypothetical protein CBM2588_A240074 [Cupriavidus taiwanensis]SOY85689.1 hypothetical protein CBM2591_A320073 [Cupriavidus taiwanensis]SOZ60269.1 hypothetical protein CBM2617_A330071 [Cupriavidus taiwanensis]SOZ80536.1 hypothetical protein CBM2618_A290073 [Cupriavidus taiwanensis]